MRKTGLVRQLRTATGAFLLLSGFGLLLSSPAMAQENTGGRLASILNKLRGSDCDNCDKPAAKPACEKPAAKPACDKPAAKPACDKPAKPACEKPAKPACDKPDADNGKKACDAVKAACGDCDRSCDDSCCSGRIMRLFDDCSGNNWLADNGLHLHGWLAQGITFSDSDVSRARPGPGGDGLEPVGFASRPNDYQLNQLYLVLHKMVKDDCGNGWGFQVDFLTGTDAHRTRANGLDDGWSEDRELSIAMPQLYGEIYMGDLSVKIGHFYTIIGYEVVTAPDNFFYSHALTMQYNEPFTHTGVLASYDVGNGLSISGGATTGWDDFDNGNDEWGFIGGVSWASDDGNTTLALALVAGEEDIAAGTDDRNVYSVVATHKLTDSVTYVFQHDRVEQDGAGGGEAYGINQYLFYDINSCLKSGLRFEWWRDDDGLFAPARVDGANYYNITAGLNYNITDCLLIRPELRFDWSDEDGTFQGGMADDQVTFGTDLILRF